MGNMEERAYHVLAIWIDSALLANEMMEDAAQKSFDEFDAAVRRYATIRVKVKGAIDFTTFTMGITCGELADKLEEYGISRDDFNMVNR